MLADRTGDLVYFAFRQTRRQALDRIEMALGDSLSAPARRRIVRASFRNVARCYCELVKADAVRERLDSYVNAEGWEHLDDALAGKEGAIAITGCTGNWEILAAYVVRRGVPAAIIGRRAYEPRVNELIADMRRRNGVQTIFPETPTASREMIRVLRSGGILTLLVDPDARPPSGSFPLFGRMARTPASAATLAVRRDLPLVPAFVQRRADGGHTLMFLPPIHAPRTGDRRGDVAELTCLLHRIFDERICRNPAEGVWWHSSRRRQRIAPP
jgi:KDO2-lipid IV(A) lauroyltransferase